MDDLTEVKWEAKAQVVRVIGVSGYPEDWVDLWIEAEGMRIINVMPIHKGDVRQVDKESALINYLADLHNLNYKLRQDKRVELGEAARGRGRPKKIKQIQAAPNGVVSPGLAVSESADSAGPDQIQPQGETQESKA